MPTSRNSPFLSVLVLKALPVSGLVSTTWVPARGWPSCVTLPSTDAPTVCAPAGNHPLATNRAASARRFEILFIVMLPPVSFVFIIGAFAGYLAEQRAAQTRNVLPTKKGRELVRPLSLFAAEITSSFAACR